MDGTTNSVAETVALDALMTDAALVWCRETPAHVSPALLEDLASILKMWAAGSSGALAEAKAALEAMFADTPLAPLVPEVFEKAAARDVGYEELIARGVPDAACASAHSSPLAAAGAKATRGTHQDQLDRPSYSALCEILRHDTNLIGVLEHNLMKHATEINRVEVADRHIGIIRERIENAYRKVEYGDNGKEYDAGGFCFSKGDIVEAIEQVAREREYHPVQAWLTGLSWDGEERLTQVATAALQIDEPTPLTAAVLRKWFLSAVKRALKPGCKVDTVLILLGEQGLYKSEFFKALADEAWFTDSAVELGGKDGYMVLNSAWIVEWAELESMLRARDQESVKAFITSREDTFRVPYAKYPTRAPRGFVIVGTTNNRQFLEDPTGNRRFWCVEVGGRVDIEWVRANRDQLWAEAVAAVQAGEEWWLNEEESAHLKEAQREFEIEDVWHQAVERYIAPKLAPFSTEDVLIDGVGKRLDQLTHQDRVRAGKILRKLGLKYSTHRIEENGVERSRKCWWSDAKEAQAAEYKARTHSAPQKRAGAASRWVETM